MKEEITEIVCSYCGNPSIVHVSRLTENSPVIYCPECGEPLNDDGAENDQWRRNNIPE